MYSTTKETIRPYNELLEYLYNVTNIPLFNIILLTIKDMPQRDFYATINGIDNYGIRRIQIKGGIWVFKVWSSFKHFR